jgi:hypothetical protein
MKKKWLIFPIVIVLAPLGVLAALPAVLPLWESWKLRDGVPVTAAMQAEAIETLATRLESHYVFPKMGTRMAQLLRTRQQQGHYRALTDGALLARQLTADLQGIAHDLHVRVIPSADRLPLETAIPADAAPAAAAPNPVMRWIDGIGRAMAPMGVEKVERLTGNVGYLDLSGFARPALSAPKYAAAMDKLADSDALIIDLRRNGGGSPDAVALLASYFVDRRTRLNDIWSRDTGIARQYWTADQVAGKRYGGTKPVVLLVGPETRSAGEDFAYTMQAMQRATVIGARTWGGAHPSASYRLGDHLSA